MLFVVFLNLCKDTNKRARNIKLAWIFITASVSIFMVYHKDTKKQVRINNKKIIQKTRLWMINTVY